MKYIKTLVLLIFIFSMVNDTFMSQLPAGNNILLLIYAVAFGVIFPSLNTIFKELKRAPLLLVFLFVCILSLTFNLNNIDNFSVNIRLIIAVFLVYNISFMFELKQILMCYLVSVLFSIYLQLFVNEPLSEFTFRLTGGTGDPNEMATMVLIFICFLPLIVGYFKMKFKKVFFLVLYCISVYSLLKAGSTTAGGVLLVISSLMLLYSFLSAKNKSQYFFLTIIGPLLILLSVNVMKSNILSIDAIGDYIERSENNEGGFTSRYNTWKAGIDMFVDNPFFGVGPGEFVNNSKRYENGEIEVGAKAAHNVLVLAFGELGFLGGIILLVIFYLVLRSFKRSINQGDKIFFYVSLSSLVLIMMGMSLSLLFDKYFWFFIALTFKIGMTKKSGIGKLEGSNFSTIHNTHYLISNSYE